MKEIFFVALLSLVFSNTSYSQRKYLEIIYEIDSTITIKEKTKLSEKDLEKITDSLYTKSFEVDKVPVYMGCGQIYPEKEQVQTKQEQVICMQNSIFKSVYKNLEYPRKSLSNNEEGSVLMNYIVDKDGSVLPTEIIYYGELLKKATLLGIKEWLKEIKDVKATPAYILDKPVKYSDFLIFTYRLGKKYLNSKNLNELKKK